MQLGQFDYAIDDLKFTSSTGEVYNIKELVTNLSIFESLNSPYIKASIDIIDAANFLELCPVIGQEKVELTLTQNKFLGIKKTFYVGEVTNYIKVNSTTSSYTIKLITSEQMLNSLVLVSQAYNGNISNSIQKIVEDYLKSKIPIFEKSNGIYSVIIPNWNPFQAIDWLLRRAIDVKQTPFAFYETFLAGFHLDSYTSLLNKQIYEKYVFKGGMPASSDSESSASSFRQVIDYDLKEYSNTYKNNLRGAFGSGLHNVDLATKTHTFTKYSYKDDFTRKSHLDKIPFINEKFKMNSRSMSEFDTTYNLVNKNTLAFENKSNNYNNESEFTVLEANSYMNQLSLIFINFTVRGRLDLNPGKIINFEVDRDKPSIYGNTKEENEYLSGKYLVVNVHHKFALGKYNTLMDCARDSFGKKIKNRGPK